MQCACANIFIHPYKNTLLAFYTQHKSYAILYYTMFILSSSTMNCCDVCVRIVCLMPVLCTLFALDSILFTFSVPSSLFNTNKRTNEWTSEWASESTSALWPLSWYMMVPYKRIGENSLGEKLLGWREKVNESARLSERTKWAKTKYITTSSLVHWAVCAIEYFLV